MLDTHLRSPVTKRRLRSGPAADHVDHFADWLFGHGYRPRSIEDLLRALAAWTDWMSAAGFTADDVLSAFSAATAVLERHSSVRHQRRVHRVSLRGAATYIRFLQEQGVIAPPVVSPLPPTRR